MGFAAGLPSPDASDAAECQDSTVPRGELLEEISTTPQDESHARRRLARQPAFAV